MAFIKRFGDITGWQEARILNKRIYELTNQGEFSRDWGLRDQIRRASVSGMTNVAEGFDCDSKLEFARFLGISRRSIVEVQSLLYVASDVGYIDDTSFAAFYAQANKTKGLIGGLKASLARTTSSKRTPDT